VKLRLQGRLYTCLQARLKCCRRPVHVLSGHQWVAARVLPAAKGSAGDRDVEATTGAVDRACPLGLLPRHGRARSPARWSGGWRLPGSQRLAR
jgi:hypothetical protein